jgi:cbb3-type cytochrome oxidase subunit 3
MLGLVALATLLAWAPRVAEACPVCMAATEEDTRLAFILTTVFLSALPLSFVGGLVWWLRRRAREIELHAARGEFPRPEAAVGRGFSPP